MGEHTIDFILLGCGIFISVLGFFATRQLNQIDKNIEALWSEVNDGAEKLHGHSTEIALHDQRIKLLEYKKH